MASLENTSNAHGLLVHGSSRLEIVSPAMPAERKPIATSVVSQLTSIGSISTTSEKMAFLAKRVDTSAQYLSIFVLDRGSGKIADVSSGSGFRSVAINPNGDVLVASRSTGGESIVGTIRGLDAGDFQAVARFNGYVSDLAWSPDGKMFSVGLENNRTAIVNAASGLISDEIEGSGAGWAPSSKKVAVSLENGRAIGVAMIGGNDLDVVYKRSFWQTRIVGGIYWSPDGSRISFNTPSGMFGYSIECNLIDLSSGKLDSFDVATEFCGPWVDDQSINGVDQWGHQGLWNNGVRVIDF